MVCIHIGNSSGHIWQTHSRFPKCLWMLDTQAWIQRLKEVSQTEKILVFPLADVCISKYSSVITCIALTMLVRWLVAYQCKISRKLHPNTSSTDLQTMMKNIDKFAARQAKPVLANTRNRHSHVLYKIDALKNLAKFKENCLCWSLVSNQAATLWKRYSSTVAFLWILQNV